MTQSHCTYAGNREEMLIAYLYDETDDNRAAQTAFATHLATCAACTEEVAALRGVRTQLARWSPPEPKFVTANVQSPIINRQSPWWREVPLWAQLAAALLVLGVSAGIANLDVKYDGGGLTVRTGWMKPAPAAATAPTAVAQTDPAPWRTELTALERELRTELRTVQTSSAAAAPRVQAARAALPADADVVRHVRALIEASEKRQQNELALRVAEVLRDVHAMRQADLVKIDRTLDAVENRVGVEVMKDRQKLNTLLVRTGSRQ
jgi:hypothetical protein